MRRYGCLSTTTRENALNNIKINNDVMDYVRVQASHRRVRIQVSIKQRKSTMFIQFLLALGVNKQMKRMGVAKTQLSNCGSGTNTKKKGILPAKGDKAIRVTVLGVRSSSLPMGRCKIMGLFPIPT